MPVAVTNTETHGDSEESLEAIYLQVRENNLPERAFVEAVQTIDWTSKDADELTAAIEMALQLQLILLARRLSEIGVERFPKSERIGKLARIVGKGGPIRVGGPAKPKLADSARWINANWHDYIGMWIAVEGDKLLGVAKSRKELYDKLEQITDDTVITQIV